MSLLLDARKKLQQAQTMQERPPAARAANTGIGDARDAGQNLFDTKLHAPAPVPINRNLLLALGGMILLAGIGAAYLWHIDSGSSTRPLQAVMTAPSATHITQQSAVPAASGIRQIIPAVHEPVVPATPAVNVATPASHIAPAAMQMPAGNPVLENAPIHIKPRKAEEVDPLLMDAYVAYRSGRLDEAQQLYLYLLRKNPGNPDILLGLASIAQQRGEKPAATQYYARVLAADPHNAVANTGMSALSESDGQNEGRLKMLLREQGDSALLHFALGNLYAGQSRWSEAQQAYFSAYTLEPGNAEFAFNLSVSLDHIGQKKQAVQYYRRALELDEPHSAVFDRTQILQRLEELTH